MRYFANISAVLASVLSIGLAGCSDARGVGSLAVSWILGGPGCDAAGITTVRVRLLDDDYDVLQDAPPQACDTGFAGITLADIPAGRFTVMLEGLTDAGEAEFEGRVEGVRIRENQETKLAPIVLSLKPASLRLRWGFSNGLLCGSNGVQTIHATLIDDLGNEVLSPVPFPCELPLATMDAEGGVLLTGLPSRRTLSILLYGMNFEGVARQFGYGEVDTAPGKTSSISVLLDSCGVDKPCQ